MYIKPILNDKDLFERIQSADDRQAFEALFHRYYNGLCRFAYKLTKDTDVSEEVVSDVFIKIWNKRQELVINTSVHAYLVMSTRNKSIDYLRKLIRERSKSHELESDYVSDYASPHHIVVGDETTQLVEAAIDNLSPQCRLIFRMNRDTGLTYNEIAAELGLSVKTIETHMGRALKSLRIALADCLAA